MTLAPDTMIGGRYKLIRDEKAGRTVLFDLAADKSETTDLAVRLPRGARTGITCEAT